MWAVLFTDLADSTAQRARIGDDAADTLRREHDEIVAGAAQEHRGVWIKGLGDGAMTAFGACADALAAAVTIQQRVARRNLDARDPMAMRIGVSVGDVHEEGGDLFGMAVNEAARLCAAADGGLILVADMARRVAGSRAHCSFVDHGVHSLKGLPAPVMVWRVDWNETPVDDGQEASAAIARRTLRTQLTRWDRRRIALGLGLVVAVTISLFVLVDTASESSLTIDGPTITDTGPTTVRVAFTTSRCATARYTYRAIDDSDSGEHSAQGYPSTHQCWTEHHADLGAPGWTDHPLRPDTRYTVSVHVIAGNGATSDWDGVFTTGAGVQIQSPTVTVSGPTVVHVAFTTSECATAKYTYQATDDSDRGDHAAESYPSTVNCWTEHYADLGAPGWTDHPLQPGTVYVVTVHVIARDDGTTADWRGTFSTT